MIVRKSTIDDVAQLSVLFDRYRVFYNKESDVKTASEFLSERIENHDSEIFVAEAEDGVLAGFVQLYPLFSSTRMKRLWLLNDLYVDQRYRGKHISVMLIDRAKLLVKETHAVGMILETTKSNVVGNKLYPRAEFVLDQDHNYYSWPD
jgi:GNAT superfamily N-acetyltransferase